MPTATRKRRLTHCATHRQAILRIEGLVVRAPDGTVILDEVSFAVPAGSLVAVVGPTGAGKTTLLNALTGMAAVDRGRILLDGVDLAAGGEQARRRIGYVPQDDALHGPLGLRRTLDYSATLRLPPSVNGDQRASRVAGVLAELGLTGQAHLPVDALSGGQRKRASVAIELIAEPDVLILDEPTSGLDPGYEKAMLGTLRELADRGRTVLTVTHSLQALALCDLALFVAPGGKVAFYGPPADALRYFGSSDAADVFLVLDREQAEPWKDRFRRHPAYARYVDTPSTEPGGVAAAIAGRGWFSQFSVLVRRYIDLIRADRRQLLMLLLQGPVLGALLWGVVAPRALTHHGASPEAVTVAVFVVISSAWLGASNAVREIVKERRILRRERGGGLSVSAYVASKVAVLGSLTMIQTAVLAAIAVSRQHISGPGAVLPNATLELMVTAAVTGLAAVSMGLLLSAIVNTPDKALSLLPIALVGQLVLSGAWVKVLGTPGMHQLADVTAARWGVQAFEATVRGDAHAWSAAIAALIGLTATTLGATAVLVRARLEPESTQPERRARGAALIPICALACSAAVVGLGAHHAPPMRAAATHATLAAPSVARRTPTATPPTTPAATTQTAASTAHRGPAKGAATAPPPAARKPLLAITLPVTIAAPVVGTITVPPVTIPPVTLPPVSVPPVTAAPVPPPSTVPPNGWPALMTMAAQWWIASHQTP
ncbi:MAG: ABC transporter ATP-binding protein/permease [Acidimicrobiales bacterium]